jgi:hypothetical protein
LPLLTWWARMVDCLLPMPEALTPPRA